MSDGIGTVQAYNMVTIKSRVDGQIVEVVFKEGQDVKAGDPLFQIDPRPFQAALDQATATKQKDEAQLTGAAADLDALRQAGRPGLPVAPELRPAEGDGRRSCRRAIKGDEAQIDTARLNLGYADDPRADRRPHRRAPGRYRQPRAGRPRTRRSSRSRR